MKYLGCSYLDLMSLPDDYIPVVLEEARKEERAAKSRRRR